MDGETFIKVYNGEIVPDKIVGEDLMTELQQELHAKVEQQTESAQEPQQAPAEEKSADAESSDK